MKIALSPQRRDDVLEVVKNGDALIINGEVFDFSSISEGDTLPSQAIDSAWFIGDVERLGGEISLTLLLPNPRNYSQEQAFPAVLLDVPNGVVALPQPISEVVDE